MKTLNKKQREIRKGFTDYIVGNINEKEARSLGVNINGGKALVPKTIADEIIGYVEQENPLRKYGKVVQVEGNRGYPVLTGDAEVHVNADERDGNEIQVNSVGLTAEVLSPVEFDSISSIKKKLLKTSTVSVNELVIEVIKKKYLKKEIDYMFNGGSINTGSLLNKAKIFTPTETEPVKIIKELKNKPSTAVRNNARWIVNQAALKYVEDLILPNGEPALKTMDRIDGGVSYLLLGFPLEVNDLVKSKIADAAMFYFGDFGSFTIQESIEGLEVETLYEKFAEKNEIGFKLYNLLDGKLIYSDLEPTVYRLEV